MSFGWLTIRLNQILKLNMKSILLLLIQSFYPAYILIVGTESLRVGSSGSLIVIWFFGVLITILLTGGKYTGFIHKYFKCLLCTALVLLAIQMAIILYRHAGFYDPIFDFIDLDG